MPRTSPTSTTQKFSWSSDVACLAYIAIATIIVHLLVGNRYGFHRDELAILEDAHHLAWGYVVYPPVTPFFGRLSLILFGPSLVGFRFFASLMQALAVFLTGLMARELGGNPESQILAALAAVPFCLGAGALMTYISFDYICWVLVAYFMILFLKHENPRWLIAAGAAIGLGMLSKYTIAFFVCGLVVGILLTDARKYLQSKWLWFGVVVAVLISLPNLIWQIHHQFVTLDFLRFLHERDVSAGLAKDFLPNQLQQTLLAVPLWVAGLWFCFFSARGSRFRALGWMYLVPLLLFLVAKGRGYYLAPAYPVLYAAGAVACEDYFATALAGWKKLLRPALWAALIISIVGAMAIGLPLAPIGSRWWYSAMQINSALPEEIGWPEFVSTLAQIRDSLPVEQGTNLGILAGNYGEVGAINLYGGQFGLPHAISGVNSFWARGYGDPPPQTLIIVGFPQLFVERHFASCRLAARAWNSYGIETEETFEHPDIFVCGPPLKGWPEFWQDLQMFVRRPTSDTQIQVVARALSTGPACPALPFRLALIFVRVVYN